MDSSLIDDFTQYGGKGEIWAPEFVIYMKAIVTHPLYKGMPDAFNTVGKIQWEAPSNRRGGKYQFTHDKRREWWRQKALSLGIDLNKDRWISKTAKIIHPTGEKPCKRCGKVMRLAYVYPQAGLIQRFKKSFGRNFEISDLEPITDITQRAFDVGGDIAIRLLPLVLSTKKIVVPFFNDIDSLLEWLEETYIPQEPSLLSPGAMSNAPDRLDGFHSFNKCCRGLADSGRWDANLLGYATDRRVFEYWSEGDWIAADRLMALVKSEFREEPCADAGTGPPSSDHIGPISLGFCHRPEFKLLSKVANTAKNNRMTLSDIHYLIKCEREGNKIASWYAEPLWNLRKDLIGTEELALRLSKQMRDNQRIAMVLLSNLYQDEKFSFLVYLLGLGHADWKVEFENLRVEGFITKYDKLIRTVRNTKYAAEQKARRIRIGFEALRAYKAKQNRHSVTFANEIVNTYTLETTHFLNENQGNFTDLDLIIKSTLLPKEGAISEEGLRRIASEFPTNKIDVFEKAKGLLRKAMEEVSELINNLSENARYVRDQFEF